MKHIPYNRGKNNLNIEDWHCSDIPYSIFHIPSRGFTIIETLVALAILALAITVPLTLAEKGLVSSEAARRGVTAVFLAQEAMEYVKNKRDDNALDPQQGKSWLRDLEKCVSPNECGIDSTASEGKQVVQCDAGNNNCLLEKYESVEPPGKKGLFAHTRPGENNWVKTIFTRKVTLREIVKDIEAEVTVKVSWTTAGLGDRTVEVKENIFNWYSN